MKTIHEIVARFEAHTGDQFTIAWDQPGPKNTRVRRHYMLFAAEAGRQVYVQLYEGGGWEAFGILCNKNSVDETLDALAAYLAK